MTFSVLRSVENFDPSGPRIDYYELDASLFFQLSPSAIVHRFNIGARSDRLIHPRSELVSFDASIHAVLKIVAHSRTPRVKDSCRKVMSFMGSFDNHLL